MVTSYKTQNIHSDIAAHTVFLLHLESMLLLAEEKRSQHPSLTDTQQKKRGFYSRRLRRTAVLLAALLAASACCARAQSTMGSILGTVQDASGAVIPGATVTVHSLDQDLTRNATTSDAGEFLVENLKAGHYSISVEHDGFSKAVVPDAQLDARQALRIPVTLTVAVESTQVVVTATGYQINTEDATLSNSKDNLQITQLPLNDRATTTSPLGSLGGVVERAAGQLGQYCTGRSERVDGELFRRWHFDEQRKAERCAAGCLSFAGRHRRSEGNFIQQQR